MREILYRGMRVDKNQWVYGDYQNCRGQISINYLDETVNIYTGRDVIPETVGQYTELYDNATSGGIYELDIVKFEYDGEEIIGTIKYERGLYIVVNNKLPDGYIWLNDLYECDEWCNCEVIGNTHDNPELMEVRSE